MMDRLLLKDYMPRSTLVLEENIVEKPCFPAIDAHNHLGLWEGKWRIGDVERLVELMDYCEVRAIANLDGKWGDTLKKNLERYEERYPGRFFTFANVDWSEVDDPDFGENQARQLEDSVRAGARGLKIFKQLGLWVRYVSGKLIPPDDPCLDPIWAKAGELGVPVLIHVADPVSHFQPLDRFNESWEALHRWPEWLFYGPQFPSFEELMKQLINLMEKHPETIFITAHVGCYAENLKFVGRMLDEHPNVYTDFSARIGYLGRQPYSAREFLIKYQDRILFGTDNTPSVEVYRRYYRFLETQDEYFPASSGPRAPHIYGVYLPAEVLEKIYHKNVERLILA